MNSEKQHIRSLDQNFRISKHVLERINGRMDKRTNERTREKKRKEKKKGPEDVPTDGEMNGRQEVFMTVNLNQIKGKLEKFNLTNT